jgi:hypothetical protein
MFQQNKRNGNLVFRPEKEQGQSLPQMRIEN